MGLHLLVDYVDCLCIGKPMARHIGLQCLVMLLACNDACLMMLICTS
jgi:hypothetical protein